MKVKKYLSNCFESNTYLIYTEDNDYAWLIDIGELDMIIEEHPHLNIKGVFLTHIHFDHIYELEKLMTAFPECKIFTNNSGKYMLKSPKIIYLIIMGNQFPTLAIVSF